MLLISRYIHYTFRILLGIMIVMPFVSCSKWREAKATIAEADSLLVEHKVVTRDTAALASAINTLDGPLGHVFAREYLAKAYYFMGRNFYYLNDFSTAADYYILCDRTNPSDPMYKGRINSCMGYLCKQDSCFEEALVFYERANIAFERTGDERRIANGLLSIAEQYVNLKQYDKADSVLAVADDYEIDSAYYASLIDIKALKLYNQQMYDSALVCLLSIKDYPRDIEERCYSAHQILQCYTRINKIALTQHYAEYVVKYSHNAGYRSNAYYVLMKISEHSNDFNRLAKYSYLREDMDRINRCYMEAYASATTKLMTYIANPKPFRYWKIAIMVYLVLIVSAISVIIVHNKRSKEMVIQNARVETELHEWQEKMREKLAIEEANAAAKRKIISDIVMMHAEDFTPDSEIWKDEKELFRLANSSFGFLIYRLRDTYRNLNSREVKICLMVLLDFPNKTIANIACCSEDSISTIKQRLAKKLSTSPRELREFLMDFILKIT